MDENIKNAKGYKARFWCEIVLALLTVAIGIAFISQIADIYYSGSEGAYYSTEIVAARLKTLIAPIVIWLATIVVCFVLSLVYKVDRVPRKSNALSAKKRLKKRMPQQCPQGLESEFKQFYVIENSVFALYVLASVFALGTAIFAIVYLSITANFSSNVNASILNLVRFVFSFILASIALFVIAAIVESATSKKSLDLIKKIVANSKDLPTKQYPVLDKFNAVKELASKHSSKLVLATRIAVFVVAVVFIGLGVANGGVRDVLAKAINICTECIGLG